jgi:hypothetical protein
MTAAGRAPAHPVGLLLQCIMVTAHHTKPPLLLLLLLLL